MNEQRKNTSPWVYVGIGCAVVAVLAVILVGSCSYAGYRFAGKLKKELTDPAAREQKVLEVLGTPSIPEGYVAGFALDVPMAMQMAFLTDQEVTVSGDHVDPRFQERSFMYIHIKLKKANDPKLLDFFEGRTEDPQVLRDAGVNMDFGQGEILSRGVIEGSPKLLYAVQRGRSPMSHSNAELLTALVMIQCAQDSSLRVGIWTGPDPAAGGTLEGAALAGSVADQAAIGSFLGQFRLCQ
jgi:hypothetical protein